MAPPRQLGIGGFADGGHVQAEDGINPVFDNVMVSTDGKALEAVRGYARAGAYRFWHSRSAAATPNFENRHRLMVADPSDILGKKRGRLYVIADNPTGELVHAFYHPGGDSYPLGLDSAPYPPHEVLIGRTLIDSGDADFTVVDSNKAVAGAGSGSIDGNAHWMSMKTGAAAGNLFYIDKTFTITDDEFDARTMISAWLFNGGTLPIKANDLSLVVATSTALGGTAKELPIVETLHPGVWQNVVFEWRNSGSSFSGASLGVKLANAIDTSRFDANGRLEVGLDRIEQGKMIELCRQGPNETFNHATIDGGKTIYFGNARNRLWQVTGDVVRRASIPAPHLAPEVSINDASAGTIEDGSTAGSWVSSQSTYIALAQKTAPSTTVLSSTGSGWTTLQSGRCIPSDESTDNTNPPGGNFLRLTMDIEGSTNTVVEDGTSTDWSEDFSAGGGDAANAQVTLAQHDGGSGYLEVTRTAESPVVQYTWPESLENIAWRAGSGTKANGQEFHVDVYIEDTGKTIEGELGALIVGFSSNNDGDFTDSDARFAFLTPISGATVAFDTWITCTCTYPSTLGESATGFDKFQFDTITFSQIGIFRTGGQFTLNSAAVTARFDAWTIVANTPQITTNITTGGLAYLDVSGTVTSGSFVSLWARYNEADQKLDLSSGYLKLRFHSATGGGGDTNGEFDVKANFTSNGWVNLQLGQATKDIAYSSISFALDGQVFPVDAYDLSDPTTAERQFELDFDSIEWGQQYKALDGNSLEMTVKKVSSVAPSTGALAYIDTGTVTFSPGDTLNVSCLLVSAGTTDSTRLPPQSLRLDLNDATALGGTTLNSTSEGLFPPAGVSLVPGQWATFNVTTPALRTGYTADDIESLAISAAKQFPDDLYDTNATTPLFYLYFDNIQKVAASGSEAEQQEMRFGYQFVNSDNPLLDISPPSPLSPWVTVPDLASVKLDLLGSINAYYTEAGNRNPDTSRYDKVRIFATTKDLGDDETSGLPITAEVVTEDAPDFSSTTTVTLDGKAILTSALQDQPRINLAAAEPPPVKTLVAQGQRLIGGGSDPYSAGRMSIQKDTPVAYVLLNDVDSDYALSLTKNFPEAASDWMRGAQVFIEGVEEVYEILTVYPLSSSFSFFDNYRTLFLARFVEGENGELELKYFNKPSGFYKYRIEHPRAKARWSYFNGFLPNPANWPITNEFDMASNQGIQAMNIMGDRLGVAGETEFATVVQNIVNDDILGGDSAYDQPSASEFVSLGSPRTFVPLSENRAAMLDADARLVITNGETMTAHPLGQRVRRWLTDGENISTRDLEFAHGVYHAPSDHLAFFFLDPETETLVAPGSGGADERGLTRTDPFSTIDKTARTITYNKGLLFDLRNNVVSTLSGFPMRAVLPVYADRLALGEGRGKLMALGCDGFVYELFERESYARGPWQRNFKFTVTSGDANSVTVGGYVKANDDGDLQPPTLGVFGEGAAQMKAVLVKKNTDGTVASAQERTILYNNGNKAWVYDSVLSEGTAWTSNPASGDELWVGRILADVQWPTRKFTHAGFIERVSVSVENEIDAGWSADLKSAFPEYFEADASIYAAPIGEMDAIDTTATVTQSITEPLLKQYPEGVPVETYPSRAAALRMQWPAKPGGVIRVAGVSVMEAESEGAYV